MKFFPIVNYKKNLGIIETQQAIKLLKDSFESFLARELNLTRVSAPLFVPHSSGLNDNLSGLESPVSFTIMDAPGESIEIVHSLAKWKRMALGKYGFETYHGLYTDMNAIRKDEEISNIHSIYVDQWDWELVIDEGDRNLDFLQNIVRRIYSVFLRAEDLVASQYPEIQPELPTEITFFTSSELEALYPDQTPDEREYTATKAHGAVFIMQIGKLLANGKPHDKRAPDYDDWELNGDLLLYSKVLDRQIELSSMGIRVNQDSLMRQLQQLNKTDRLALDYHQMLMNGELPLTIGGGIGQSRLCMFLLKKAHVAQVQASIWDDETRKLCAEHGLEIL